MTDPATIAKGLSEAERLVLLHARFDPKGWEPKNPTSRLLTGMIEKGLFTRADGRCGFEAFKDAFVVPTDVCLKVVAHLRGPA